MDDQTDEAPVEPTRPTLPDNSAEHFQVLNKWSRLLIEDLYDHVTHNPRRVTAEIAAMTAIAIELRLTRVRP